MMKVMGGLAAEGERYHTVLDRSELHSEHQPGSHDPRCKCRQMHCIMYKYVLYWIMLVFARLHYHQYQLVVD